MNGMSSGGMTTKGRIMSRSSCSRMWQWYMYRPANVSKRTAMSTTSLGFTRTVSLNPRSLASTVCGMPSSGRYTDSHGGACFLRGCCVEVDVDGCGVAFEKLERVEVHVDRMGVAGEVDEPPYLGSTEHREERGGVLESGRHGAPSTGSGRVPVRLDDRDDAVVGAGVFDELAQGEHGRLVGLVGAELDERDCCGGARLPSASCARCAGSRQRAWPARSAGCADPQQRGCEALLDTAAILRHPECRRVVDRRRRPRTEPAPCSTT